jgi:hypothetical protein
MCRLKSTELNVYNTARVPASSYLSLFNLLILRVPLVYYSYPILDKVTKVNFCLVSINLTNFPVVLVLPPFSNLAANAYVPVVVNINIYVIKTKFV